MTTKTWVLIALIALLPSGVGHTLMTWSQKHLDVTVSSLMMLGSPCVAMVAAWLVRHEALDPLQIVGAVIVIACLAGIMVRARRRLDPLEATLGEPV
jgi:drug/metabolite transporter (DMT)-like permease